MHKAEVLLRDKSGRERLYLDEINDNHLDSYVFLWEEGNFACDCNRSLFLYENGEAEALPCGDTEIRVVSLRIDGAELYHERE